MWWLLARLSGWTGPPAPPSIGEPRVERLRKIHLSVSGPLLARFELQASTDLTNWFTIASTSNITGNVSFEDFSSDLKQRFYRAASFDGDGSFPVLNQEGTSLVDTLQFN